ncbi:MAG: hypothetical protein ACRCU2_15835, partial [Planktothrix sp.]
MNISKIPTYIACIFFAVGSLFDGLTTVVGVTDFLGRTGTAWVLALGVTGVVLAINYQTKSAFSDNTQSWMRWI